MKKCIVYFVKMVLHFKHRVSIVYKSKEIFLHPMNKMENIRKIVIIGGQDGNPSRFISQVEPVNLTEDCEMALTALYHGEVYNIHDGNNKVYFYYTSRELSMEALKHKKGKSETIIPSAMSSTLADLQLPEPSMVIVPEGSYSSVFTLCWVISNLIREKLRLAKKRDGMIATIDKQYGIINIEITNLYMVIEGVKNTPWMLMGVHEDQYSERFTINDSNFHCSDFPGFVYANIIENSYINGRLSRNLGLVPIKTAPQWSLYEPAHPNYVPINIKQFSTILIELRDIKGQFIKFNPNFKTVISLSIRPIKGDKIRS